MTFFYNLNKTLDAIREKPETTHGQLNERANSKPVEEDFGATAAIAGGAALGTALGAMKGRYDDLKHMEKDDSQIYNRQHKPRTTMQRVRAAAGFPSKNDPNVKTDEGLGDVARKVGGAVKKVAGKALDTLGHGSDEDLIRDMQKKAGLPQTGKKPQQVKEKTDPVAFAALAEPKDKITFADKIAGAKKEVDEMLGDVAAEAMKKALGGGRGRSAEMDEEASQNNAFTAHKRPKVEKPAVGTVTHGRKHDVEEIPGGRRVTRRVDPSGISVGADDEAAQSGEKRGRGRPKKAGGPAQERVTAKSRKVDRTRFQSKKTNEGDDGDDSDIQQAMAVLKKAGYKVSKAADGAEQVDEKAVSKKQQKFMGMVHATQKGEKAPSKEVAKVAKTMKKGDAEDFAATKHKGLPEKKKPEGKKKEKTEEAGGTGTPTASSGFSYGKGIYDSMNRELETMIAESMSQLKESMSINMSMNNEGDMHGGANKSLTVTATDEDAVKLGALLKMAGLGGGDAGGCGCGSSPCSCGSNAEVVDENQPDWPTDTEQAEDNFGYSGGLNKPKSTGQTTVPVIASQDERQESYAAEEEDAIKRMMEMAGIKEGKKPDFLDVDKDGDKKEPFKKAVDDKKEEKVDESIFAMTAKLWKSYKG